MEQTIVSLEAPGSDWARLVRFVERSGQPLWLEADGEIRGILLPIAQARRLMGCWARQRSTQGAAQSPSGDGTNPQDPWYEFNDCAARP